MYYIVDSIISALSVPSSFLTIEDNNKLYTIVNLDTTEIEIVTGHTLINRLCDDFSMYVNIMMDRNNFVLSFIDLLQEQRSLYFLNKQIKISRKPTFTRITMFGNRYIFRVDNTSIFLDHVGKLCDVVVNRTYTVFSLLYLGLAYVYRFNNLYIVRFCVCYKLGMGRYTSSYVDFSIFGVFDKYGRFKGLGIDGKTGVEYILSNLDAKLLCLSVPC